MVAKSDIFSSYFSFTHLLWSVHYQNIAEAYKKLQEYSARVADENITILKTLEEVKAEKEKESAVAAEVLKQAQDNTIVSRSMLSEEIPQLAYDVITSELESRGLKERYHAWVDRTFKSSQMRALFKYNLLWMVFIILGLVGNILIFFQANITDPMLLTIVNTAYSFISSNLHYLLTHVDTNKDGVVDVKDIVLNFDGEARMEVDLPSEVEDTHISQP